MPVEPLGTKELTMMCKRDKSQGTQYWRNSLKQIERIRMERARKGQFPHLKMLQTKAAWSF